MRTWAALAVLVLIWGTTWAAIRVSLEGIPPITGVALRFAIASAALLALLPVLKVRLGSSRREWAVWITNGLFTFCLSYSLLYWAEQWVPSGLAAVLFATFPLIVAVIAHFALPGEQLTRRSAVGVLIGFAGVAVIFSEDFQALLGPKVAFAAVVMLLCPLFSAIGSVSVKKWGAGIHPLSTAAVPMGLCALALAPIAWIAEAGREVTFSPRPVLALFYLGLVGSAFPFTLYFWLLKRHTATGLSLINYGVPVVAVTVGSVFMDEPITLRMVLGAALVIVGVAVSVRPTARTSPNTSSSPQPPQISRS